MREYIIMMRVKEGNGTSDMRKWRRANDFETTKQGEAIAELDILREEFPDWEFRIATLEPE